jgi:ATPase subunit of ABC transporter with duplicated ATPase domains
MDRGQSPKARQAKSKARIKAYEELVQRNEDRAPGTAQIIIPPGERLGDVVIEADDLTKAFGEKSADRRSGLQAAARRDRRRHRPKWRGQNDAVPNDHRARKSPMTASIRLGETVHLGYVDQSRDSLAVPTRPCGRKSPTGMT